MVRTVWVIAAVLGAGFGCGGGPPVGGGASAGAGHGGATLDCAWLAGDNCWKMTAADATACLPPETETGTLSADNKTCTYASGVTVTFTPALILPIPDDANWDFTISNGGVECLHYEDSKAGIKLVTMGHTVTETPSLVGIGITCPDGTTSSTTNAFALLDCGADAGVSLGGLPGSASSYTATAVSVGLIGTSTSEPLFNCQKM